MKKLIILLLSAGLLLLPMQSYAADSYDNAVSVRESKSDLIYYGVQAFTAGAEDSHYTQAMYIGDMNLTNMFLIAWTNATGGDDVNVFVQYSYDRTTWVLSSIASGQLMDDLNGGTVQADTINVINTNDQVFHAGVWMRLYFDGQTGNTTPVTVTWSVHGTKYHYGHKMSKNQRVKNRIS